MSEFTVILLIVGIAFGATLFRSTFGFGEALIAVPLLSMFLPLQASVPIAVLMSITVAAVVVVQDYRQIHLYSAKWLIIYAVAGIPIGLLLLFFVNQSIVKTALGLIIIVYCAYSLSGLNRFKLQSDSKLWLFICGFLSGVFGGAYGVNGPPLVVYGNMRQWNAKDFRATLQAYFLIAGIVSMIGYSAKGLISTDVLLYFSYTLPAIIPAIFIGRYLNRRLKTDSFYRYVYFGLTVIGCILIVDAAIS